MNDTIVKGSIAGIIGTIGDFIIHQCSLFLFGTSTTTHYIAQLVFHKEILQFSHNSVGFIIHFIAGALTGILLALIFNLSGKDHPFFKGIGLGLAMWILHVAVIPNIINTPLPIVIRNVAECYVDLASHVLFGILATLVLVKLTKQKEMTH